MFTVQLKPQVTAGGPRETGTVVKLGDQISICLNQELHGQMYCHVFNDLGSAGYKLWRELTDRIEDGQTDFSNILLKIDEHGNYMGHRDMTANGYIHIPYERPKDYDYSSILNYGIF